MIEGWPDNFPFANLSAVSCGLPELENLLRKWHSGAIFWKHLTSDEFEHLQKEYEEKIESGDIVECRRCPHSDRGKKRRREGGANDSGCRKKSHKSTETVDTDSEDEQPQDPTPPSTLPPPTQTTASDGTLPLPPQTPTNVLPPAQTSNTSP
jgi:hypothetical protein